MGDRLSSLFDEMMQRLRSHLSYSNVMATIAVFIALGGSSYAVIRVGSSDIVDGSIRARDIHRNTLGGRSVRERSLGRVPRARVADSLGSSAVGSLKLRCPSNTNLASGLCFDVQAHSALSYGTAVSSCTTINAGNRRLPSHAELEAFLAKGGTLAPGGEMTSTAFESRSQAGVIDVILLRQDGSVSVASGAVDHPFRCVTNPTNG